MSPTSSTAAPSPTILEEKTTDLARRYMHNYDASHDMSHISRVLRLARHIAAEEALRAAQPFDDTLITLGALLHDVHDHKYMAPGVPSIQSFLLGIGTPLELVDRLSVWVANVSYSNERRNAALVKNLVQLYPELGIVMDADRLDALGAIGIGRCFTYGASRAAKAQAQLEQPKEPLGVGNGEGDGQEYESRSCMEDSILHFGEKLELLEGMMKTETGRRLAKSRTKKLALFKQWWQDESDGLFERELHESDQ